MSTPTNSKAQSAQHAAPEAEAKVAQPYKPLAQKAREMLGLQSDEDMTLLRNDAFRVGGTILLAAVNPLAGAAAGTYTIGASIRDRGRAKAARLNGTATPAEETTSA